uniref:uncharacterized protein LOC101291635 n=1 Tax=Fragaria vesca subsp. vesca TaxID=101020 RepID=UPI0005C8BEC1|nr:PREDICTED: uncharacterized protein LOC101291635 [Fragaria vesca subsp. vesca]
MHCKTSKNTKFQKIDLYDGSTDPYDHLDNFRSAMDGKDATEADRCKAFPQTLKGSALNWFRRIPAGTIKSFGDMRRAFLDEFMIVSNRVYTPNNLTQIHQLPEEGLRDYVIRFQGEYHRCEGADEKIAYAALMGGFRSSPFLFKIFENPPGSFKALMREATNYSRAENLNYARDMSTDTLPAVGTKRPSEVSFGAKAPTNEYKKPKPSNTPGNARTKPKVPLSRYGKYTPLAGSKTEIFAVVSRDLPEPKKIRPPTRGRIDESHYCRYHREYGHTLEKCVHLADAYQALIDRGAPSIQRFIKRDGDQTGDARPAGQETRPNNPRAVINTISGGPTLAGTSNRAHKAYARAANADIFLVDSRPAKMRRLVPEPITFTDEDGEGLIYPHNDPIIIKALIDDCEVPRVLVDGGRAVNIISATAFAKLGVDIGMLTRGTHP